VIVGCIALYGERVEQALVGIKRLRPFVDRYVVVVDETVSEDQKAQLRDAGCEVYFHPWHDDFVEMRNHYLEKCQTDDWAIVHDPDEWFNQAFCEDIRKLIEWAVQNNVDRLCINSHDVTYQKEDLEKGTMPQETVSDFFKNLIFRKREGAQYIGKGEGGRVHEGLVIPGSTGTMVNLHRKYWYTHVKYWHEIWERATRNVFIGGGGINIGGRNPSWKPLRQICSDLGIESWGQMREYMRKGNVDSKLKDWMWENRFEGWDYQHEMMEMGRWYYEYLHPEEATYPDGKVWKAETELREGSPPEVMNFVEKVYMEILGRHADQEGKENYTKLILSGQIRRVDLPDILRQSSEYWKKMTTPSEAEGLKLELPVSVDVKITEDLLVQVLMRSKTYWEKVKPRLDLGKYLEEQLGPGWGEFQKWYYSEQPTLEQFLKRLKEATGHA